MWLRLRQIALVAAELDPVVETLCTVFGVEVCYRDPGVAQFGLHNALMPVGNQFIEVVAPTEEGTAGGRYLDRRGGDGGYMIITQCDDHPPRRAHVDELGVRLAFSFEVPGQFINMQLHPKDTGGAFFEIDQQLGEDAEMVDGPWHPAGPAWKRARHMQRVSAIKAAELQSDDPEALAERWATIAQIDLRRDGDTPVMPMQNADVRFVPCRDGRPEGLGALDIATPTPDLIVDTARALGALVEDGPFGSHVAIGGMRLHLVDP